MCSLRELCEIVPDIVFDIPKLYEYLPAMFAGIISSGTLPLQTLQTSVVKVIADSDTKKATKLFLDTLSQTRSLQVCVCCHRHRHHHHHRHLSSE